MREAGRNNICKTSGKNILIKGIKKQADKDDRHNKNFKSVMGKIWLDEEGNVHTIPTLQIIKNGKPVQMEF